MNTFEQTFGASNWFEFTIARSEQIERHRSDRSVNSIFEIYCFETEFRQGGLLQYLASYSGDGFDDLLAAFKEIGFQRGVSVLGSAKEILGLETPSDYESRWQSLEQIGGEPLSVDPFASLSEQMEAGQEEMSARVEEYMLIQSETFLPLKSAEDAPNFDRPSVRRVLKALKSD